MNLHELQQENQALKYRNDKLKANYRKMQINLSEKEERIKNLYRQIAELQKCKYCKGTGYEPYHNHDTTLRPCPECGGAAVGQRSVGTNALSEPTWRDECATAGEDCGCGAICMFAPNARKSSEGQL